MEKQKILIVDDDGRIRNLLKIYLEKAGFQVSEAENGLEALLALHNSQPNLIVLDIMMPVLDGIQATQAIRHASPFARVSDIPVIALTAHAMAGDQDKFLAAGMDGYLSKPFDLCRINEEISRVISLPRAIARRID